MVLEFGAGDDTGKYVRKLFCTVKSETPNSPTPLHKKIEKHAQPPALGGWLGFGRGSTPTVSCGHKPTTKPSSGPDCGSLGPALRGPWHGDLEYFALGSGCQMFSIMDSTT